VARCDRRKACQYTTKAYENTDVDARTKANDRERLSGTLACHDGVDHSIAQCCKLAH
jgi:hypothetical protein